MLVPAKIDWASGLKTVEKWLNNQYKHTLLLANSLYVQQGLNNDRSQTPLQRHQ
jgi:hypothetical protein